MYSYDRRTAARFDRVLSSLAPDRTATAIDMDMAKVYADNWTDALIGKLAPRLIPPVMLGSALRDSWFDLVGVETRSLQWRSSKWLKPAEWAMQMKTISPEYNSFHAGKVGSWLAHFAGVEVQPAREYSVCVYVKGHPEELSQVASQAKRMAHATQVDMQEDGTLRLWWG